MGRPVFVQLEGSRHLPALLQVLPGTLRPVFVHGRLWGPCLHKRFDCYRVERSKHEGRQHWRSLLFRHFGNLHKAFSFIPPGVVVPLLSLIGGIVNVRGDGSRDFDLKTRSIGCKYQPINLCLSNGVGSISLSGVEARTCVKYSKPLNVVLEHVVAFHSHTKYPFSLGQKNPPVPSQGLHSPCPQT